VASAPDQTENGSGIDHLMRPKRLSQAMNAPVRSVPGKWSIPEPFSVWSGALATAGGVVFYGTLEGYLKAS
jgi:glucose dehydrogenase